MASKTGFSSDEDGALSDINVTPLVDVVLVLLIVFMITVPAIVGSAPIKLDLPVTSSVAPSAEALPLAFSLKRGANGEVEIYLEQRRMTVELLRQEFKDPPPADQHVSVGADAGIPHGEFVKFLDLLQSLGMKKVSIDTQHVEQR
jgi:biopolymer transport protein ExbD